MGIEIEKKFLTINDSWREQADDGIHMVQGYMGSNEKSSIRVRINGNSANLNIKSKTIGIQRSEYEYDIPVEEAKTLLATLCDKPYIEKTRYHILHDSHQWEIDVFSGENDGLIVAELELESVDESYMLPDWVGREVSDDPRYYNICLVTHPYKDW